MQMITHKSNVQEVIKEYVNAWNETQQSFLEIVWKMTCGIDFRNVQFTTNAPAW